MSSNISTDTKRYNKALKKGDKAIAELLAGEIGKGLRTAENKVWHRHPVWFLDGNPIVGYSKLKDGVRLMFWSGVGFKDKGLVPGSGKFKDASVTYTDVVQVKLRDLKRWLKLSKDIQWDYKNIVKRRGVLKKLATKKS